MYLQAVDVQTSAEPILEVWQSNDLVGTIRRSEDGDLVFAPVEKGTDLGFGLDDLGALQLLAKEMLEKSALERTEHGVAFRRK